MPLTPRSRSRRAAWALVAAGAALVGAVPTLVPHAQAAAPVQAPPGVQLPSGRLVTPAGSRYDTQRKAGDASYDLGDFPLGLALSPDGRLAVASLNGRGYGTPHTNGTFCDQHAGTHPVECPGVPDRLKGDPRVTAPDEGLDVVDLTTGKTVQVVAVPTTNTPTGHGSCGQGYNCFGYGVTFSPDGTHLYAAGGGGDDVYDFAVKNGTLTLAHTTAIPSPATQVPGYPVLGTAAGYPRALKVTPDGKTLVVVDEFDSTIETLDVTGGALTLASQSLLPGGVPGPIPVLYPYDLVLSADGATAYVTAEGTGAVLEVPIAGLAASGPLSAAQLAPAAAVSVPIVGINHPTGLALSPDGSTLAVAGTDSDNLALVPLTAGVPSPAATLVPLEVVPRSTDTLGSSPDAVAWSKDGSQVYVALAGDDSVAVVDAGTHAVKGFVPTGWYPTAVAVGPKDGRLYSLAAKGLGSRYVPGVGGYVPGAGTSLPTGGAVPTGVYYDAENMPGLLTRVTVPADLSSYSATAATDVLHAAGLDQRSPHNPVPAVVGGTSPITHVVYVVRENRTYDQVFGDLGLTRKDADADPSEQLLAAATPNAHAVAGRFATADHYFSDGEASVQGHWWTSSAMTNDYVEKSWRQYYSPRGRPQDQAVVPITSTPGCSIFQKLQGFQVTHPTFTFRNYGELVGLVEPTTTVGQPTANLCHGVGPTGPGSDSVADPNYPSEVELTPDDRTRAAEFLKDSGLTLAGTDAGNGNTLRNFNYLIMSEDHTTGLGGTQTPRSQVAQNDAGVGQIISALSKSPYWSSTAVVVTEDDSQDGVDHLDGHRNVLLVASPYAKQRSADDCLGGYIGHAHYDQASLLRTVELILGVTPISAYDAGATPMYDLFQDKDSASQLTKADLAPFTVAKDPTFIDETVASLPKTKQNATLEAYSKTLDLKHLDVSEAGIEDVLWQSVRPDPVPFALADKVAAPETGESSLQATTATAEDLQTQEVRPGRPLDVSTATGKPLVAGQATVCAAPVVLPHPVAPGTTHVPGRPTTGGHLPTTGPSSWPVALGSGLLLLVAGGWRLRRGRPTPA